MSFYLPPPPLIDSEGKNCYQLLVSECLWRSLLSCGCPWSSGLQVLLFFLFFPKCHKIRNACQALGQVNSKAGHTRQLSRHSDTVLRTKLVDFRVTAKNSSKIPLRLHYFKSRFFHFCALKSCSKQIAQFTSMYRILGFLFPVYSHIHILQSIYSTLFYLQMDRTFPVEFFCTVKLQCFCHNSDVHSGYGGCILN